MIHNQISRARTEILNLYVCFCMMLGGLFAIYPKVIHQILIFFKICKPYEPQKYDMSNKVCLVTGAASGIGLAVARRYAQYGATVILADRNTEGAKLAVEIQKEFPHSTVEFQHVDFADFTSIDSLVKQLKITYSFLDVLVNNAGIGVPPRSAVSKQNYDLLLQVNFLAHVYLTIKLEPLLLHPTDTARIINTSSITHRFGSKTVRYVRDLAYTGVHATGYATSKLGLLLLTLYMNRRRHQRHQLKCHKKGPQAIALDPGAVSSNIWASADIEIFKLVPLVLKKLFLTPDTVSHLFAFAANDPKAFSHPYWTLHPDPLWINKYVPFARRTGFFVQQGALVGPCKGVMVLPNKINERLALEEGYMKLAFELCAIQPDPIETMENRVEALKRQKKVMESFSEHCDKSRQ